jgi:predicted RNase H-like nuclease
VRLVPHFTDLLRLPERPHTLALDMPIGLLSAAVPGGRACDMLARKVLGRPRASSVFTPSVRQALAATDYRSALAINRASALDAPGLSIECFYLFAKLREVDAAMTAARQRRVKEVHPELGFAALNDGTAMRPPKRSAEGYAARRTLLMHAGYPDPARFLDAFKRKDVQRDDLLDAHALLWSAARIARGEATRLPRRPSRDDKGLAMEIWF